jgi:hypothetical protein
LNQITAPKTTSPQTLYGTVASDTPWGLDMKRYFASALLVTALCLPAKASSIELLDDMVTGAKGSASIVTMGQPVPCEPEACVDKTGGDPALNTAAAQQQAALDAMPLRKINFTFARKFPDPAVPVPSAAPVESSEGSSALEIPAAPADSGTVAAQPPVGQPVDQASISAPNGGAPEGGVVPVVPLADSELREGE